MKDEEALNFVNLGSSWCWHVSSTWAVYLRDFEEKRAWNGFFL